ncbi:(Fe-S)-binding protein [Methylotenera sp.]|jgi:glycolate oxidase iron-sulfur subunit|uniref:(Fe-S)-binding protein n=1 Tax=Methylotenera sp. TaxID=2051956 RepID=UPI00272698FC|nr:(Fe-S)-binding protein [Methylotenera sp.]MDO9206263.1 (Fe-S)-binding protein [Methylotenera sp.]
MTLSLKELTAEADRCVACGLCLPHCPTYRKTGSEADSPRGRIQLIRAVSQDILPNNARFKEHIDLCLSCRSCESACPNSVNYGALVDTTRALYIQKRSVWLSIAKPFIRHRRLSNAITWPLWFLSKLNLMTVLKQLVPAAKLLPTIQKPMVWKSLYPATQTTQGAVSLFLGCATNAFDNRTLSASIYVLNALGYDVHVPKAQTCCGSIARQAGDDLEASLLIKKNASSFDPAMPILTTASGCSAGLKDYLTTHQIQDISTFLVSCDWSTVKITPLKERIYVQDPCSLRNVLKAQKAVYDLLKKIPEADIQALPGNSQCCGGAGAYSVTQPEMANQLLNDKLTAITANQVTILATSNIGCSLHINKGLNSTHASTRVTHPIEIIAKQMGFEA